MGVSTESKMVAGFCLAFLLMVGLGVATYRTTQNLLYENERVTHTYEVLIGLDQIIASMTDAQNGQRGYVITGDERFLEPYNDALPTLTESAERVRQLTADNPNQTARVAELRHRAGRNLAIINEVIARRRRGDVEAAANLVKSGQGKAELDAIKRIAFDMKNEENRLLAERTKRSEGAAGRVVIAFFALTLVVSLLLLFSYLLVKRDVAQRRRRESVLREASLTDELTGLYNRRGFLTLAEQQVKLARRTGKELLLLFADMDGLKKINDTFGHDEGSRAITVAGTLLRGAFRESDIPARLGGDEFAVLMVESDKKDGVYFSSRLRDAVKRHNAQSGLPYELSLSVGVVRLGEEFSIEDAINRADALMYEDKRGRRSERLTLSAG